MWMALMGVIAWGMWLLYRYEVQRPPRRSLVERLVEQRYGLTDTTENEADR
jgi:hypothetical protein